MVVVHRAFRREFGLLPRMVRAVPGGDRGRAGLVATHARSLIDALQHHHEGEDALIWPRLHVRTEVPQALVYLMESQHAALAELMRLTGAMLDDWAASASAARREELAVVLDNLAAALTEHLDDEERCVLPIVARTLNEDEWEAVATRGMEGIPKADLVVFLGALLEDATAAERTDFLKKLPPQGRLLYRLVGERRYRTYVTALRGGLTGAEVAAASRTP